MYSFSRINLNFKTIKVLLEDIDQIVNKIWQKMKIYKLDSDHYGQTACFKEN